MLIAAKQYSQWLPACRAVKGINHEKWLCAGLGKPSRRLKSSQNAQAPTVFSGIQPTGVPHLGNFLGALREWFKIQEAATENTKLIFSIVDLHALTVPQQSSQLRKWRKEALATLIAVGLDPNRSTIFYQSSVCCNRSSFY
jgi:tryptophanyl-tRNA synthetase